MKWKTRADLLALLESARLTLERDWEQPLSTEALARSCGLSVGRFIRLFKDVYGLPPRAWRSAQRMKEARRLLQTTSLSVSEIAVEVGLASSSVLCRRHRASHGASPSSLRRERRKMSIQERHLAI